MTTSTSAARVPVGYHIVASWIVTWDTGNEIDFLREALCGVELGRVLKEDGSISHSLGMQSQELSHVCDTDGSTVDGQSLSAGG